MSSKLLAEDARLYRVSLMQYVASHTAQTSVEIIRGSGLDAKRVYSLLNKLWRLGMLERSAVNGGRYFHAWCITNRGRTYLDEGCQSRLGVGSNAPVPDPERRVIDADAAVEVDRWWRTEPPRLSGKLNWGKTA